MPFNFAETTKRIRDMQHEQNVEWERVVAQAKPHFTALKRYITRALQLGKGQRITFRGTGIAAVYQPSGRGLESMASIDATIHTGINGCEITLKWMPKEIGDLDRKIAAVRDALAAIRME